MAVFSFAVCLTWILTVHFCWNHSKATVINTTYGPVSGSVIKLPTNKTAKSYLGIPFAKAERLEYPVEPDKWTTTLVANKTEKICPQPTANPSKLPLMSEDCLLLNVYVPGNATSSSAFAVMLWFHGGAFILGDTLGYDGSVLATEENVIVVTAAYRLGVLGFLSANSGDLRGNYGLLDQIEALKWVNKNIERFGGDPNKVNIFGGSAGGMCVALLMLSPLASGLYQNVIMQSGTAVAISSFVERDEADSRARSFAEALGCTMNSLKTCTKEKSVKEILAAQDKVFSQPILLPFGPVVDGYLLPDSPAKLLQAGKFNKTNIIIGVARDDGSIFISGVPGVMKGVNVSHGMPRSLFKEEIKKRIWVRDQNPKVTDLLIYEYTDWSDASNPFVLRQQFFDLNSDATFKAPAIQSADAFVKKGASAFFYQLEQAPKVFPAIPFPLPPWYGVYHRADLPFVFGNPLTMAKNLTTAAEIELSKGVMTMWANFAKTGNPNTPVPLKTPWPQYTSDLGKYLGLSSNLTVRSKMRPEKMALWNEYLLSLTAVEPTMASKTPAVTDDTDNDDDHKDILVMVLAILTGVFGALALIFLVLLIVRCQDQRNRGKDYEEAIHM